MGDLDIRLREALEAVRPADRERVEAARRHWDAVAKPLRGLGQLENVVSRLAGTAPLRREMRKCVAAFCADNGVVAEGVTQTDSGVTAVVAGNMLTGAASVCCMGAVAGAGRYLELVEAGDGDRPLRGCGLGRGCRWSCGGWC